MIESFGVPHAEVELIVANGAPVDFSCVARAGDRIAVYPMFESLDVQTQRLVRPAVLRDLKFVMEAHLAGLTAYLRMPGIDALYDNRFDDPELVRISSEQQRVLLTRDRGLLKHDAVSRCYWLRQSGSRRQLAEVLERFNLEQSIQPFTRCMACNGLYRTCRKNRIDCANARIATGFTGRDRITAACSIGFRN
jgi:uncharacterized protein with PIN domain